MFGSPLASYAKRWVPRLDRRPPPKQIAVSLAIALSALLPIFLNLETHIVRTLCVIGIYALLATGLNIVVGRAGLLDLGYVAFFGLGSYAYALLASPHFGIHLPFPVGLAVAILVAAVAGVLLGTPVLRLRGDYLAIVTLGFGEITYLVLLNLNKPINITNGPNGILNIDPVQFAGLRVQTTLEFYYLIGAFLLLGLLVAYRLSVSRLGRAWEAVREDERAARAVGINPTTAKLSAFAIGASYSGAAGTFSASLQGSVFPDSFLFTQSVIILSMVVIGGMGTLWGPVVGAALMIGIPELLRGLESYRFIGVGLIFVITMLYRPHGLLGGHYTVPSFLRRFKPSPEGKS